MDKFLIIDGNSLVNRAYYAMPFLTNREKQPSGAVFGFVNLLTKLILEQKPKYIAVCFDHARKTFRNEIYAEYKGTRKPAPEDLVVQFQPIKDMLKIMGIKVFEQEGIEADDIIGTIAKHSCVENILVSGDRDLLQLIDSHTRVWLTRKGVSEVEDFDEVLLKQKMGLVPSGIIDLKALMGDSSDNIPGIPGVGEKTALSLLEKYGDLDKIFEREDEIAGKLGEKVRTSHEIALISKKLATIKTDCDIDFSIENCSFKFPFSQKVRDFFVDWDFRVLQNRKELFEDGVCERKVEVEKVFFNSLQDVENFSKNVTKNFCYDLKQLEFSFDDEKVFCIKKEIDLFSPIIDLDDALKIFKPIFENQNILKISNSIKSDMKVLKRLGISINNFFDIDVARYVLSAGIFKDQPAEVGTFLATKDFLEKKMKEENVDKIYSEIEIPLVKVLFDMESEGFRLDENMLDELTVKYTNQTSELSTKIFALAGEQFNLNSPKQMAYILFDKLGLQAYNNKKQSTSFEILDQIRYQHEIVELIIEYRKINKLLNTYINVYQNICKGSGPVVHTIFNQTLTSTGRLSSSEPNLQNIPTRDEEGKNLRKIFISKFDGGQIVSADYSQIELRLLANMANEDSMIEAYKNGVDIHAKTASEIFGVPIEEVTSSQRSEAKAVNFGIIYGISDFGLSQNIKTSRNKAKRYIESYFERYPKIKVFMDKNIEFARENGYIKSYFGRIRHIPEINASNGMIRRFGERVAMNTPLQSTASDIIKMAMVKMAEKLSGMKSHLILQIHDELIVDSPKEEVDEVKKLLKETMENVCEFVVPLKVSVSSGNTLYDCK